MKWSLFWEFDGLAVRRMPIGFSPGFLAFEHRRRIGQLLHYDKVFESCQPVVVVARAIVVLAAICRSLKLFSKRGGPFTPCEMSLCGQPDGKCKRLRLPGLGENGATFIAGQTRQ